MPRNASPARASTRPQSIKSTTGKLRPPAPPQPRPARAKPSTASATKAETILAALRQPKGVTIAELSKATGWQAHSIRGFMSGTLKKKQGLTILTDRSGDVTRYRLGAGKG